MPRIFNVKILETVLYGGEAQYTDISLAPTLAAADSVVLQVITDDASGTGVTLTATLEISNDGRNWVAKDGTPIINATTISTTTITNAGGVDTGNTFPNGGYLRVKFVLGGTGSPRARAVAFMCGRSN